MYLQGKVKGARCEVRGGFYRKKTGEQFMRPDTPERLQDPLYQYGTPPRVRLNSFSQRIQSWHMIYCKTLSATGNSANETELI